LFISRKSWLAAAGIVIAASATMLAPAAAWAQSANLEVIKTGPTTVEPGANATYAVKMRNLGPNDAANVSLADTLPPNTTFVSFAQLSGPAFTTTAPAVGGTGTVTSTLAVLTPGNPADFLLVVNVNPSASPGIIITNAASATSSTPDPDTSDNFSTTFATVIAGPATHFSVSAPAAATTGTSFNFTVTPLDAQNNIATSYSGSVHFASTDGAAVLPADTTISGSAATFSATLNTAASQTITVTTPKAGSPTGTSGAINVVALPATHFSVSAPAAATTGTSFNVTVTALNAGGTTVTGYVGTVHFTSSDGAALLPADSTLTNGVGTFSVTLNSPGSRTITATDTVTSSIAGTTGAISVSGPANHFSVSAPAAATAGAPFNFTVTALDSANNIITGYAGTVHFTSTDGAAVLPANSTLTNGVGTFSATLNSAGSRTITATDTVTAATTGTSGPINVGVNATSTTLTSSQNPSQVGQAVTFTAAASSSGGTPTGTVIFKDGAVVLGAGTLSAGGIATFTTSTLALGSHSITASYAGATTFAASASASLIQTVNTPTDSLKLRALQVLATPVAAQTSGMAISGAVDNAITEGFSDGGALVMPNGGGVRFNFAADPDGKPVSANARSTDPFSSANGSFASSGRTFATQPSSADGASPSHIDDTFSALAYAGPTKARPLRVAEPKEWLGWAEVRGATLDHWGTGAPGTVVGAPMLYGNQVNLLAGLTRKFTSNFLIGVLGGYETFDYRSDALQGRLKGDGWTVGSYLGWRITEGIRFDAGAAYSGIGYNGTAGTAAGSFNGNRWLVTGGLTGTYNTYGVRIEPSARVYALWEHENAYTDTLGTMQAARDFSTGRASGGMKLSYPIAWCATTVLAPYVGFYGDYYFNSDNAGTLAAAAVPIPANFILDGWSARAVGGLTAQFGNGAQVAVGGERSGIGGNFGLWTYRARASVPFAPQ
jgi:uncharacterized repeat protein (TIGR01451 family)